MPHFSYLTLCAILPFIHASPVAPRPAAAVPEQPLITPSPALWEPSKTYKVRRDIISGIASVASDISGPVGSILSDLGSAIPSYVASGVPNFFQDFPVGADVQKSLGLQDSEVAALPTQVLNIP